MQISELSNGALNKNELPQGLPGELPAQEKSVADYEKRLEESKLRLASKKAPRIETRGRHKKNCTCQKCTGSQNQATTGPESAFAPAKAPASGSVSFSPPRATELAPVLGSYFGIPFKLRAAKLNFAEYELTQDEQVKIGAGLDQLIQIYIPDFAIQNPKLFFTFSVIAEIGGTVVKKEMMFRESKKQKKYAPNQQPPVPQASVRQEENFSPSPSQNPDEPKPITDDLWQQHGLEGVKF